MGGRGGEGATGWFFALWATLLYHWRMPETLLRTKLLIPPLRPNLVPRRALVERLNEGLRSGQTLTVIAAPAGFGKTTLAREWVAALQADQEADGRPPIHVAWLALDAGDSELTRFLTYVAAALKVVDGREKPLGQGAQNALQAGQPPTAVLTALMNDLAAFGGRVLLVLDDYHLVDSEQVDEALDFLLQNMPPSLHLVIISRHDPHLALARMRARGHLTELRAADLRFTAGEAGQFLGRTMGLDLEQEAIAALEARTEGWIAGLQLAAISMRGREDTAARIEAFTGSHRFVLDYLLAEVLQQQPQPVQAFLLQTAVLDALCAPLCDALTGRRDGHAMLAYLERANLFLVPLDDERRWYRYHHLFADLLRQRLGAGVGTQIPILHRRAATWYADKGMLYQATEHALAAGDWAHAAVLAEAMWPEMDESFQLATWLRWARALPPAEIRQRPLLATQYAWALNDTGELEAAALWIDRAEEALQQAGSAAEGGKDTAQAASIQALIALARSNFAHYRGDAAGAIHYAREALRQLPENEPLRRSQATALLGIAYWSLGDLERARHAFATWISSMERAGNIFFAVASGFALADVLVEQARLNEAMRAYEQSLRLAAAHGEEIQALTAHHHLGLAMLYFAKDDEAACAGHLAQSEQWGAISPLTNWRHRQLLAEAYRREAAGELDEALRLLDEAQRAYAPDPVPDIRPIAAIKARVAIRQGRLATAAAWASERGVRYDEKTNYLNTFERCVLARLLIAQYEREGAQSLLEEALSLLARLQETAEAGGHGSHLLTTRLLQALAYEAGGDRLSALAALQAALEQAEPEGYVRLFTNEGLPLARLLAAANSAGVQAAYTEQLLAAFPAPIREQLGAPGEHSAVSLANARLPEPLSPRELEVLSLIAGGLTNRQIAERLVLAQSTVKVHIRNVYAKLSAHHRAEAVAKANALGLIAQD